MCSLHLRSVARRIEELSAANVREIAVFHSEAETLRPLQGDLPFDVIADPTRALYRRFGVESSMRSVLDPRAWGAMIGGMIATGPVAAMKGEGGHMGLPADFLIEPSGKIAACKYGVHANDQWSVDEILALVDRLRRSGS